MNHLEYLANHSRNFGFLAEDAPMLAIDGASAELYVYSDPDASMFKTRRFGETLAHRLAAATGAAQQATTQVKRIAMLADAGVLTPRLAELLHRIRVGGNKAIHTHYGNILAALNALADCHELGAWLHRTITGEEHAHVFSAPAPPPFDQPATSDEDRADLETLTMRLAEHERRLLAIEQSAPDQAPAELAAAVQALEAQFARFDADFQRELIRLVGVPALHRRRTLEEAQTAAEMPGRLAQLADEVESMLGAAGWTIGSTSATHQGTAFASRHVSRQPPGVGFILHVDSEPAGIVRLSWADGEQSSEPANPGARPGGLLPFHYLCSGSELRFLNLLDAPCRWRKVGTFHEPQWLSTTLNDHTAAPVPADERRQVQAISSGANSIAIAAGRDVMTSNVGTRTIRRPKGGVS